MSSQAERAHRPLVLVVVLAAMACLGLWSFAATAGAVDLVLTAVADATVVSSAPTSNFGTASTHTVGFSSPTAMDRALLRFDLSAIPSGSTITTAILQLSVVNGTPSPSLLSIEVWRNETPWSEMTVAWSTQPVQLSFGNSTFVPFTSGAVQWDVLNLVTMWLSGAPNHGVALRVASTATTGIRTFSSREAAVATSRPQLLISYTLLATATPTGSTTATRTATPAHTTTRTTTPTPSATTAFTVSPTNTATFTRTATRTPTATGTHTITPSSTRTVTSTSTATATRADTATPMPTSTPSPTPMSTFTSSPSPTSTRAPSTTTTPTPSQSATATATRRGTPPGTPTVDPQIEALRRLQHDSRRPVYLRIAQGIPRFVGVEIALPNSPPDDPVAQALDFLDRYRDVYRLESPRAQLYLERLFTNATGAHVFFGQHYDGVPIYLGEIAVHLSRGVVWYTSGRPLPNLPDLPAPSVDPSAARMIAAVTAPGTNVRPIGEVKLMYFDHGLLDERPTDTHLAWRVHLRGSNASDGSGTTWMYFIDAHDGAVLFGVDESQRAFQLSVRNADHDTPDGCFADDVEEWLTEDGPTADYPGVYPGGDRDADDAYLAARQTYDFFLGLGRDSYDGQGARIRAFVHYNEPDFDNAAWDPACQEFWLGDDTASDFTFGHEFTHAVISFSSTLGSSGDPRALGESYGDVFGSLVRGSFGAIMDPTDRRYFDHMDRYEASMDYANSGIPSKAAYLIIEGGPHREVFVRGLDPARDREQARRLFYDTMITLRPGVDLLEAAEQTFEQARAFVREGLWSFTDLDVCWVRNAYAAVGLGATDDGDCDGIADENDAFPDADADGVQDDDDNCPVDPNPRQENTDNSNLGDACNFDDDHDRIKDDGDDSEVIGDHPCTGGETEDCDDNCRTFENPDQADADNDGIGDRCDDDDGDGVLNSDDNCPGVCNPDRANSDMDLRGDACDPADDNEGDGHILDDGDGNGIASDHPCTGGNTVDCDDNCRAADNVDQADRDDDGVGDICDNCPDVANPARRSATQCRASCVNCPSDRVVTQADTDDDGLGDACDPDCDNDGILNEDDLCRCVYDFFGFQADLDRNGIGINCDEDEQFSLSGDALAGLNGNARFPHGEEALLLPIFPCSDIGCPDWLPEGLETRVQVTLPFATAVNIVDERGYLVHRGERASRQTLAFAPRADFFYRAAAAGEGIPQGVGAVSAYHGTRYFLQIVPPPDIVPDRDYPLVIAVRSGVPPACLGDCGGDARVTVDELVRLVGIALETQPLSACGAGDRDFDRRVTIEELVAAVQAALVGCP